MMLRGSVSTECFVFYAFIKNPRLLTPNHHRLLITKKALVAAELLLSCVIQKHTNLIIILFTMKNSSGFRMTYIFACWSKIGCSAGTDSNEQTECTSSLYLEECYY